MSKTRPIPYHKYDPTEPIAAAMQEARKLGLVRIIRNEDGEPVYAITKKGERYVEVMPVGTAANRRQFRIPADRTTRIVRDSKREQGQ